MDSTLIETANFAPQTEASWRKLAEKALKGLDFEQTLISHSDDGIAIKPLYSRLKNANPISRCEPASRPVISQRVDCGDEARSDSQVETDLENGASGLAVIHKSAASDYGVGMKSVTAFTELLLGDGGRSAAVRLEGNWDAPLIRKVAGKVHYGIDPVGTFAFTGTVSNDNIVTAYSGFAGVEGTILNANGRLIHNAGGTEVQELAYITATLAHYIRVLDGGGISPERAFAKFSLCLSANQNQFLTIAKLRAVRLIFARLQALCGVETIIPAHVYAETSWRMLTRLDPETNILRNTIATFSAIVGGADEICVLPHTITHGLPDPLARRLARNTATVLIEECHLAHVADPAAGSGGIEALTDQLCDKAWQLFQEIEKAGGIGPFTLNGGLTAMLKAAREARQPTPIVGTSLYPAEEERPVYVLQPLGPLNQEGIGLHRLDETPAKGEAA
jgi:methylmalonyl-CoA mutase